MTRPEVAPDRRSRVLWLAFGVAGLAAWALLAFLPELGRGDLVVCLFRRTTGIPCPGCGLTRAFFALARGDFAGAFAVHPLAVLIALQIGLAWAAWGVRIWRGPRPGMAGLVARLAIVNAAALLGVWGLRLWSGTLPR